MRSTLTHPQDPERRGRRLWSIRASTDQGMRASRQPWFRCLRVSAFRCIRSLSVRGARVPWFPGSAGLRVRRAPEPGAAGGAVPGGAVPSVIGGAVPDGTGGRRAKQTQEMGADGKLGRRQTADAGGRRQAREADAGDRSRRQPREAEGKRQAARDRPGGRRAAGWARGGRQAAGGSGRFSRPAPEGPVGPAARTLRPDGRRMAGRRERQVGDSRKGTGKTKRAEPTRHQGVFRSF